MRGGLIAVADPDVQSKVVAYPPVVLKIETVIGVYREIGLSLLGIAVTRDVAEHDIRQSDAARVGNTRPVGLEAVGSAEIESQPRVRDIVLNVIHPQPFITELEGMSAPDLGEVLVQLVSVFHTDPHGAHAELRTAVGAFRHAEVDR